MIKIYDFNSLVYSGISYGGHGGSKKGIIIDDEKWFLKYPKSTRSMEVQGLSYTTSPLSEYIGSHIYDSIGLEVHDTKLGISNQKLVVACKDFLNSSEVIVDYNSIKNEYDESVERAISDLSSSTLNGNNDIEEILVIMDKNSYFKTMPNLKQRFWDMFVIDAFISNNDRNEGNWGLVLDKETKKIRVAPVFDNGASFYSKSSDERLNSIYMDDFKFKQSVYESSISIYRKNGKPINPLKFIEKMDNKDCNEAILRIVPKINFDKIEGFFNELPKEYNGIVILSDIQRKVYLKSLKYRYENVLLPIYNKLVSDIK